MALTKDQLSTILATLPTKTREAYAEGTITEAQLESYARDLGMKINPDFDNVVSGSSSTERKPSRIMDVVEDVLRTQQNIQAAGIGGAKRTIGGMGFAGADDGLFGAVAGITGALDKGAELVGLGDEVDAAKERGRKFYGDLFQQGQEETKAVEEDNNKYNNPGMKSLAEPLTDFAGSPSSLASIFGGPTAVIPAADVYGQEYVSGRLAGLDKEAAKQRAGVQAGIEAAIEAVPSGSILQRIPGLNKLLGREAAEAIANDITKVALKTSRTAAGEGLEEGVTTLAQLGADKLLSETTDDEKVRSYANDQLPKDIMGVWDATWRSIKAGAVGGTAIGGPMAQVEVTHERAKLVSDMLAANADQRGKLRLGDKPKTEIAPTQEDMFGTPEGLLPSQEQQAARQKELEQDAGFSIMRRQRAEAGARARKIAGVRQELDIARQTVEKIQDAISNGRVSGAQANTLAAGVSRVNKLQQELDELENAHAIELHPVAVKPAAPAEQLPLPISKPADPAKAAAVSEAASLIQKDKQDQEKARVDAYNKLRNKARSTLVKDSRELPDAERTSFVADELAKWDAQNPLDKFVLPKKTTTSKKKAEPGLTVNQKTEPVQETAVSEEPDETSTDGLKSADELKAALGQPMAMDSKFLSKLSDENLDLEFERILNTGDPDVAYSEGRDVVREFKRRGRRPPYPQHMLEPAITNVAKPMAQQQSGGKTDTTADDILSTLSQKMGGSDAKKIGKLIADKNMVVVNDVSEVPGNAQERGAGFYDGNRTYIVANRINKKNAMGEVLSIAAHEVKHAADLAGSPQLKASLGGFIGEKANTALRTKIEALAKVDKGVAKVVEAAKAGGIYELELPAYFINYARRQRDAKGPVARLAGNIVSAVRTKFGGDVDLNDVAYMSDKLLKEVAVKGERLVTGVNDPLPMFLSNGTGKFRASLRGRLYQSADGAHKYEIADDNSYTLLPTTGSDVTFRLGNVLHHDALYEEMPDLKNIKVRVIDDSQQAWRGFYNPDADMITVNLAHTQPEGPVNRAGLINSFNGRTHRTLLHEVQHAVQARGRTTGGSSPEVFNELDYKLVDSFRENYEKRIDEAIARGDEAEAINLQMRYEDFKTFVKNTEDVAYSKYRSVLGEQEAFATADRVRLNQEDRDAAPEIYGGNIENKFLRDHGVILDQRGNILAKRDNQPQFQGQGIVLAFNPDFLSGTTDAARTATDKLTTAIKTQFKNFGGLERKLGVMKEDADGFAARAAHRGMNFYARINEGINIIARQGVKDGTYKNADEGRKAVKDMIEGRLEAISKIEDPQRREAALGSLSREHPELSSVVEAITESTNLSRTILLQMIEDNPNPTPKELKLMNTIYNNMFRYSTRLYSAFQGEPGRVRSRRLVAEYNHAKDALAKRGVIPEKFRESFETYVSGMKYLIDHDITIPEDEVLDTYRQDRIDQLFDTWVQDGASRTKQLAYAAGKAQGMSDAVAKQFVRQTMLDKLKERRGEITDEQYEATAHDIIRGMLELEESSSPFASYYRGFKQDRGILQEREHVAPEIRELLGEITDPATRLAVTISKQGELVARTRLLLDMKEKGNGRWVMPAVDARMPGNEKFSVSLDGENWGPLQGWRATPEVARSIGDTVEMIQTLSDALARSYQNTEGAWTKGAILTARGTVKLAGVAKMVGVVFEPFGVVANGIGSMVVPLANGVINPKYYGRGMKVGAEVVLDTLFDGKGKLSEQFEDAVRWGILDSARVQEIRRTPQEFVRKLISNKPKAYSMLKTGLGRTKNTAVEMFAMSDAWAKIAAFEQRVDVLRNFYKAEGIEKTDDEIKSEAADNIKDTNITYARTIAAVRNLESVGLTTFLPYFYSVPRALTYGYIQAGKDLIRSYNATTTKGKAVMAQQGLQRLAGNSVATMGVISLLKALASAINGDDEDKYEEMKKLMTEDARFSDSIYLGKDELGNPLFARLSRVDAYGPVNDALRVILNDDLTPAQKSKYTVQMISDLLFVNRFTKSAGSYVADQLFDVEVKDKETRVERTLPKTTEAIKDWMLKIPKIDESDSESAMAVLDSFSPGWLDTVDPSNRKVADPKTEDAKALGNLIIGLGGRLDRADPGLAALAAGQKVKVARDAGRSRIAKGLAAGRDDEKLEEIFLEYSNKEWDAMRQVGDTYSGMVNGMGMTPRQASAVLKDKADMTNTDLAAIRAGRVNQEAEDWINSSRLLSKQSMTQRTKGGRPRDPEEVKAIEERAEAFRKKMKALGYKVRE